MKGALVVLLLCVASGIAAAAEDLGTLAAQVRATEIALAQPPFSWKPETVEVQEGGKLALSTGPVLDAAGKRIATFTSIWRREPSGEWKIIFDRGSPDCDSPAR